MKLFDWLRHTSGIRQTQATVEQIHSDFLSAGEQLLAQAKETLDRSVVEKAAKLKALGFTQASGVSEGEDAERLQRIAELIQKYSLTYPNYKFITEEKVNEICKKYGLIYGPVSNYTGHVPDDKLNMIASFDGVSRDDYALVVTGRSWRISGKSSLDDDVPYEHMVDFIDFERDIKPGYRDLILSGVPVYLSLATPYPSYKTDDFARLGIKKDLLIVAPKKEFNLQGMNLSGFQVIKNIPDPVVLAPIRGGFLILAAWGPEASDEIVVNPKFN